MTLPASGALGLSDVNVELGNARTSTIYMTNTPSRNLAGRPHPNDIKLPTHFWGKSLAATYQVTSSAASVNEGGSFTITFTTNQAGSFSYQITGVSSSDINGASLTGTVSNGSQITYNVTADNSVLEGNETFTFTVGANLASTSVLIYDSSYEAPYYTLTTSPAQPNPSVYEGSNFSITFLTNVPGNFDYTITGVSSSDIGGAALTGTISNMVGIAYGVTYLPTQTGNKNLTFTVSKSGVTVATATFTLVDRYYLLSGPTSMAEGSTATYTLTTHQVNEQFKWTFAFFSGTVGSSDFTASSGYFNTNGSGVGTFTITSVADQVTEGSEYYYILIGQDNQPAYYANFGPYTLQDTSTYPAAGTVLGYYCDYQTYTKYVRKADGNGGWYDEVYQANSVDCGYSSFVVSPTGTGPFAVNEGYGIQFNCTAVGYPNQTLYWTILHGTTSDNDFYNDVVSGSFSLVNGSGSFTVYTKADNYSDGGGGSTQNETFQVQVHTGSIYGPIILTSPDVVTVIDSSQCPAYGSNAVYFCDGTTRKRTVADGYCGTVTEVVQYNSPQCGYTSWSASPGGTGPYAVAESETIVIYVNTVGIPSQLLFWNISYGTTGIADFVLTYGSFNLTTDSNGNGTGQFPVSIAYDTVYNESEYFYVEIRQGGQTGTVVATTPPIFIQDMTPPPPTNSITVIGGATSVYEGSGLTFLITAQSLSAGGTVWWAASSGTYSTPGTATAADLTSPSPPLGSSVLNSSKQATVDFIAAVDAISETSENGGEQFYVTIHSTQSEVNSYVLDRNSVTPLAYSPVITILDQTGGGGGGGGGGGSGQTN